MTQAVSLSLGQRCHLISHSMRDRCNRSSGKMKLFCALLSQLLLVALSESLHPKEPILNLKDPVLDLKDPIDPALVNEGEAETTSAPDAASATALSSAAVPGAAGAAATALVAPGDLAAVAAGALPTNDTASATGAAVAGGSAATAAGMSGATATTDAASVAGAAASAGAPDFSSVTGAAGAAATAGAPGAASVVGAPGAAATAGAAPVAGAADAAATADAASGVAVFAAAASASANSSADNVSTCTGSLAGAVNDFSFSLNSELMDKEKKNIAFSPLSVATSLAVMYHGSGGKTAEQLEKLLEFKKYFLVDSNVTEEFMMIMSELTQENSNYKILMANEMFLQEGVGALPKYSADLTAFFMANVQNLDFKGDGKTAMNEINIVVADKTEMKIPKLLDKPISPAPTMVLVNVVYFKGKWKTPFPKEGTNDEDFTKLSGSKKKVKMMSLKGQVFRFTTEDINNYSYLELPYVSGDLAMLLALPTNGSDPVLAMNAEFLCSLNETMSDTYLDEVKIPKFKIDFGTRLNKILPSLGVTDLFQKDKANLTGITGQNNVHLGSLVHKAILEVDEEGTEAAAVTAAITYGAGPGPAKTFVANHPFLVYILDKRNGIILFAAKVVDP